jgi:ribosomal protein L37AE/L43A
MGAKKINLVGLKFNRLHVIELCESKVYGTTKKRIWKCKCDCGKIVYQNTGALTTNNTKS